MFGLSSKTGGIRMFPASQVGINNTCVFECFCRSRVLSISQAALKTIANVYKSENKRLGIDTRIIELPNLANGITSMTVGEKKLFSKNFTKKIIKESFI